MNKSMPARILWLAVILVAPATVFAWDYAGHRTVNELALKSLPENFPKFVRTPAAAERIAFLAGEADRWRNSPDYTLRHASAPDHFFDMDYLADYQMKPEQVSPFRFEFVAQLTRYRVAHPDVPPKVDPAKDTDRGQAFFGFLPWAINEHYSKLKSAFSYLKTFEDYGGTPEEIRNAQENVIYLMGVMGHFVGDSTQPLHTTKHYNGWVDANNPKNYSTKKTFHSWVDGGYLAKIGMTTAELLPKVRPAQAVTNANSGNEGVFRELMRFLSEQHKLVEPLYALDRDGKLSGNGDVGMIGKPFLYGQLLKGGQMLGDLWFTAWQTAPKDGFLQSQLAKRKLRESGVEPTKKKKK